ncbi:unnamed protein product [Ectocarpus sp. CCAP 1310/34]|nr:unnamed protein product [Ectocarpus sp. CCAP 1310/34]
MEGYHNTRNLETTELMSIAEFIKHLESDSETPSTESAAENAVHATMLSLLWRLQNGELVSLDDGIDTLTAKRSDVGIPAPTENKGLVSLKKNKEMLEALGASVHNAYYTTLDADEINISDDRRVMHVVMPVHFNPRYVANLHLGCQAKDKRIVELEDEDSAAKQRGSGVSGADAVPPLPEPGDDAEYEAVRKADDIRTNVQDPVAFLKESCPPTLLCLLMAVCGWDPRRFDVPARDGEEWENFEELQFTRRSTRENVFAYMVVTMLGRAVHKDEFRPPHFLKLSQALKYWGVGAKPMSFLTSINLCAGDGVRWVRENYLIKVADTDLLTNDPRKAIMLSLDNNDVDPTARFSTAEHGSANGAAGHEQILPLGPPLLSQELDGGHGAMGCPMYLNDPGKGRSCLEVRVRRFLAPAKNITKSKNLWIQPGSTKSEEDNFAALDRLGVCGNMKTSWSTDPDTSEEVPTVSRMVLVEGDQETYSFMVKAKQTKPEVCKWLIPHPGGWHILLHASKALLQLYYGAGVEAIARLLGAEDKHAADGSNYRRNHHLLTVVEGQEVSVTAWLRQRASTHQTLKLWTPFLLEDYPAYLALRMGGRTGNYPMCVMALRKLAPMVGATGKTNYVTLCINHLTTLARIPANNLETIGTLFTASFSDRDYTNYFAKLPRICDDRTKAIAQVEEHLIPAVKDRKYVPGLIRDRSDAVEKALVWLRKSPVFAPDGAGRPVSLFGAQASSPDGEAMLTSGAEANRWWEENLKHYISLGSLSEVILPLAKGFLGDIGALLAAVIGVHRQSQEGGDSESDGDDGTEDPPGSNTRRTIRELMKTKENLPSGGGDKNHKAFLARYKVMMLGFVQKARGKLPAANEC